MAVVFYGTETFVKHAGYFGEPQECEVCHQVYQKSYVRVRRWAHLDYVPLFPTKTLYFRMCPICARGQELSKKDGKAEIKALNAVSNQKFEYYAKHILAEKKKGFLATDDSYEFWVKDVNSGAEFCIAKKITKDKVKAMKKGRGIKNLPVLDV